MSDISQIKLPDNTTYNINAKTVNGHTVGKDVPSSAVFTDQYVSQVSSTTEDDNYRILLSGSVSDNTKTESVRKSTALKLNPKYDAITIGYDRASGSAYGVCSFTQGSNIVASGQYSHGEGWWTIANHRSQHVFGEYNIADSSGATVSNRGNYIEIVGNGTENSRSNARTLDWSGNEVLAGNLTIGGQLTDKWGLQSFRSLTTAQYNALSSTEKNNGTYYHLTDSYSDVSFDSNVSQTPTTADHDYRVLLSGSDNDTASVEGALKNTDLIYNPYKHELRLYEDVSATVANYVQIYPNLINIRGNIDQMRVESNDIWYNNSWDGTNNSLKSTISTIKQSLSAKADKSWTQILNETAPSRAYDQTKNLVNGKKFSDFNELMFVMMNANNLRVMGTTVVPIEAFTNGAAYVLGCGDIGASYLYNAVFIYVSDTSTEIAITANSGNPIASYVFRIMAR